MLYSRQSWLLSRFLLVLIPSLFIISCGQAPLKPDTSSQVIPETSIVVRTLEIVAVGDMMLGTTFPRNMLAQGDGSQLLADTAPVLRDADITFGNLEGTLLENGTPRKQCKNPSRCYLFRSPPRYAGLLKQAGFDVVSLANNHAQDFGAEGISKTQLYLDQEGIRHTGQWGDIASWQVKDIKVAFIAYSPFYGSNSSIDLQGVRERIVQLSAIHDLVVVSLHAGAEGKDADHVPFKEEIFFGENRGDVVEFAHTAIDAGADLVFGHGPHVPRALELYKGRLVAYSLGNFCTYYGINVAGKNGFAPILKVKIDQTGEFKEGQIISARQVRPQGPVLDKHHRAAKLIKKLTEEDFPETALKISAEGKIERQHVLPK